MSTSGPEPTEEELRAAYEAEIKKIKVEQVVLENIVTLVNLGMRRTGLAPGTEDERDAAQVRVAIDAIRALLPLLESSVPQQLGPIRDALSQLQMAYVRIGGAAPGAAGDAPPNVVTPEGDRRPDGGSDVGAAAGPQPEAEPPTPGEAGPAQRSGRLWIPGQ
jgi:hypothetical protein